MKPDTKELLAFIYLIMALGTFLIIVDVRRMENSKLQKSDLRNIFLWIYPWTMIMIEAIKLWRGRKKRRYPGIK